MNRSEQVQGGPQVNKREQVWGSPSEQIEQVHMWIGSHMGRGEGDLPSGHMISPPSVNKQTRLKTLPSHRLCMRAVINSKKVPLERNMNKL